MSLHNWFGKIQQWLESIGTGGAYQEPPSGHAAGGHTMFRGLAGRSPEIADLQEEVAAEQQGRVALVSRSGELNCWLLAALREQAQLLVEGTVVQEGFFTLVLLPSDAAQVGFANADDDSEGAGVEARWAQAEIYDAVTGMDLVLYLYDPASGWNSADDRWHSRLRALGTPLLPVAVADAVSAPKESELEALRRHLGVKPAIVLRSELPVDGAGSPPAVTELVERILGVRPRLAIPLAQEVPAGRQLIARRVIRTAALMAMLVGAEPLPLLDLPLTVLVQWKMALQLAAIHGRPGLDVFSQEMAGTVGLNLIVRLLAQQASKFVPVVGWVLSSLLNLASTWLLGQALMSHYDDERRRNLKNAFARPGEQLHSAARHIPVPHLRRKRAATSPASPPDLREQTPAQPSAGAPPVGNGAVSSSDFTALSNEAHHG